MSLSTAEAIQQYIKAKDPAEVAKEETPITELLQEELEDKVANGDNAEAELIENDGEQLQDAEEEVKQDDAAISTVKISLDGVEKELSIDEVAASYKAAAEYTAKREEIVKQEAALGEAVNHYKGLLNQETQQLELLLQAFNKPIATNADIAKLFEDGDVEQATRLQFQESQRQSQFNALQGALQHKQQEQEALQKQELQYLVKENTVLLHKHAPHIMAADKKAAFVQFLTQDWHPDPRMRFSQQEIDNAVDARIIVMADKLRQLTDAQKARPKPQANIPKVSSSSTRPQLTSAVEKQFQQAQQKLASSGKTEDAVAFYKLKQQMKGA